MFVWVEDHPYLSGALALLVIVLFLVWRSRSSSAATSSPSGVVTVGPSDSLQAAAISAGVQMQTAQLAAQTQVSGYNDQLAAIQTTSAADVTKTAIAANVYTTGILASAGVQNNQTAAALQLGLAQIGVTPKAPAAPGNNPTVIVGQGTQAVSAAAAADSAQSAIDAATASPASAPGSLPLSAMTNCTTYGADLSGSYGCVQGNDAILAAYKPGNPAYDAMHAVGCAYGVTYDAAGHPNCSSAPYGTPNPVSVPDYSGAFA